MQGRCLSGQRWLPYTKAAAARQRSLSLCTHKRTRLTELTTSSAATPKVVPEESAVVERLERSLHLASSEAQQPFQHSASASPSRPTSKRVVDEAEVLHSTLKHRVWVYGATALFSATLLKGLSEVHTWQGALNSAAAVLAAYFVSGRGLCSAAISCRVALCAPSLPLCKCWVGEADPVQKLILADPVQKLILAWWIFADFLTGIYHWSVDNYGDGTTPIVGSQIAAFQGHHQKPWTITEREFCNNVHKVCPTSAPIAHACVPCPSGSDSCS